ncbi:MAG TPA: ABC transporter permease [Rhizomicrobium sp.]|jgi:ABC-2 type transport system permease protein|nr:ABC transporter permease [Rhizomicrobium sp.]
MRRTLLIARQEFVKYVTRRGFFISILMFPLWIMVVTLVPQWTGGSGPQHHDFTVVDRTGGAYRDAIAAAALRGAEARRAPAATAQGGHGAPRVVPRSPFAYEDAPDYLVRADDAHFAAAVRRALRGDRGTGYEAPPALDTVVLIPAGFGGAGRAQIWSSGRPDSDLREFVDGALTRALQIAAVHRVAPQISDPAILDAAVQLEARDPDRAAGANATVDSIVPIALAIILFVVSVMNSSVLLQGVVEEKSTRMIEVLLSCATPREITSGKLIGVIAVALTTLVIWGLALFALMGIASHGTVGLVMASLRATASLDTLPLLLVFFLCGLLIYGSLFLAIGSMANSLADAQSLLGPSMLILMLPNVMIAGVIRDPNGALASALSWVPIYTPYFMMLRIASHPPPWQLWGTLALAVTTTVLLIWWTGRVFAKHVLTTERPPSLGALIARFVPGQR